MSRWDSERPKKADPKTAKPYIMIGAGELSAADRQLLTPLLGRFGVTLEYFTPDEYQAYLRNLSPVTVENIERVNPVKGPAYNFADLTSPSHYLVREHLLNFGRTHRGIGQSVLGRVFVSLVDGGRKGDVPRNYGSARTGGPKYTAAPQPMPGLTVVDRQSVDLTPYTPPPATGYGKNEFCAQYAIEVGSLIDYSPQAIFHQGSALGQVVVRVAHQLQAQIADTEQT